MPRILLVDDEPRIVTFLAKGLRRQNYESEFAFDGRQALDLALSRGFDLVVLDLGLPIMDGFDVISALRASQSSLPVIIITARSEVDCARAVELGADDYLSKPFKFSELLPKLQRLLKDTVEHPIG